ncbi:MULTISPECIES: hypothetical protein [unclassified Acidocella]|uniref:hypothetical protein n=1 Tax=unclassified Acidocella TaxID=2648610 RepID=UPI001181A517|nr:MULTISPECIES: hypothetical protein [unclassified Acidocella]WBO59441.1 hypothetical protein GT370_00350 [Acidocella sp. MX-AZ03]
MTNKKAIALSLALGSAVFVFAHQARASGANNGIDANNSGAMIASLRANAVSPAQLANMRGGSGTVAAINIGNDTGNSANNSITGSISNIQSVNSNTGLTTVIQNTGNNTLLQSSMTVNITVH